MAALTTGGAVVRLIEDPGSVVEGGVEVEASPNGVDDGGAELDKPFNPVTVPSPVLPEAPGGAPNNPAGTCPGPDME